MAINRNHILAVTLVVLLAGCGGLAGIGGPSISDTEATVVEGQPVLVFDYEIDDFATALLEGPNGNVLYETRIEPEKNTSTLYMGQPQGGEYRILIREGGETLTTETLEFDGPELVLTDVSDNWSSNSLESVEVTIENTGDLPARIERGTYQVDENEAVSYISETVEPNESVSGSISPGFGVTEFEEPGLVEGDLTVETSVGNLSGEFSRDLKPASLSIAGVNPVWSSNALEEVIVRVRNSGDVPTEANVSVEHQGEEAAVTGVGIVDSGELVRFEATPFFNPYEVQSGGEAQFDVFVNSPSGRVSDEFTRDIAGADVSIESVDSTWESGRLTQVQYTADNAGEIEAEYDMTVEVNGETVSEGEVTIPPEGVSGQTLAEDSFTTSLDYAAASGGEYEVTVTLDTGDGTVSASDTVEFEGIDSTISEVDTTFFDQYDSNSSELSSVDFSVRNDGDIALRYDSVEIEIGGASRTDDPYGTQELEPGSSSMEYVSVRDSIVVDSGSHDLTIRLLLDGDTVASETTTVSTE
ncbi:hypothetical protein [Halorubrum ezzemoulense]|uniref:hypothetical protein n=1 Tax=Halorubrum ezzemoulense TaxID=337243 RepID=UPI00211B4151|nr:hypothetical protein [Halorubrum ezzemoulense]